MLVLALHVGQRRLLLGACINSHLFILLADLRILRILWNYFSVLLLMPYYDTKCKVIPGNSYGR
jgi:hypothetical protein